MCRCKRLKLRELHFFRVQQSERHSLLIWPGRFMRTGATVVKLLLLVLAFLPAAAGAQAEAPDYKPSISEAALLPRFCWAQFMGPKFRGPEFDIPRDTCGVAVNHYCIGLIDLGRANRTFDNSKRRQAYLLDARKNTVYTLRGIEGYPHCPIRRHVEATFRQVESGLRALQ